MSLFFHIPFFLFTFISHHSTPILGCVHRRDAKVECQCQRIFNHTLRLPSASGLWSELPLREKKKKNDLSSVQSISTRAPMSLTSTSSNRPAHFWKQTSTPKPGSTSRFSAPRPTSPCTPCSLLCCSSMQSFVSILLDFSQQALWCARTSCSRRTWNACPMRTFSRCKWGEVACVSVCVYVYIYIYIYIYIYVCVCVCVCVCEDNYR